MVVDIKSDNKTDTNLASPADDVYLLTPGPLTTSAAVKQTMLHDIGSRDKYFINTNRRIIERLLKIAAAHQTHVCVPLQGSGTFAIEAMLANLIPRDGKLLNLVNGAYGHRISDICTYLQRDVLVQEAAEIEAVDPGLLAATLSNDTSITHVSVIHCETTSGILNPLSAIAEVTAKHGRRLLIDAMSSFGALPLKAQDIQFEALAASSNKCLQGVPGMGFCIVNQDALVQSKGNSHSLSLDLHEQWQAMENNGQWRFTPPTHCLLALDQALQELEQEGGVSERGQRYTENCKLLVAGMRELGFKTFLPDELQAPIIVTFYMPADPAFNFNQFYARLSGRGYVIYPGKLTAADTFRIGCIGEINVDVISDALEKIKITLEEMGVEHCGP